MTLIQDALQAQKLSIRGKTGATSEMKMNAKWQDILPDVSADLAEAGVVQPSIRTLAAIAAKVHTGESAGGKGLLLMGTTGTGKTFLLRALSRLFDIPFATARDIADAVADERAYRELMRLNIPRWSEIPKHWNDLIIDDLGAECRSVTVYGRTYYPGESMIFDRAIAFERGFKTHFSTNLTEAELKERYGDRCWSRMSMMCVPVTIVGPDRRQTAREAWT
nr:MAG TPA: replicative helicase [Caudoviricetes sp.]